MFLFLVCCGVFWLFVFAYSWEFLCRPSCHLSTLVHLSTSKYSCLGNLMDGGAWWAAIHGVAKSWTRLSDCTFTFHFHALEKEMATHSSVLALRIPGMGEPGGLPSMGSHRVGHNWSDLAAACHLWRETLSFLLSFDVFLLFFFFYNFYIAVFQKLNLGLYLTDS